MTAVRPFPLDHHERAVVVAAHPADQLRVSGLAQWFHEHGTALEVVVATDGCRSELHESLGRQGLADVPVRWLGLPDSTLAEHRRALTGLLAESLADADVCIVPWPDDPDPDRRAAGAAALTAAPVTTHRWSYPVGPNPDAEPAARTFAYRLTECQRHRRSTGAAAFGARPPHGDQEVEIVFRQPPTRSAPLDRFADLYAGDADPWHTSTSWYERRKRALALAALPRERYGCAVEPACGAGVFTRELAGRCDRLVAFDPVPAAVARATAATADLSHVDIRHGALPAGFPADPVDLVVFGEILYYLDDPDLAATVGRAVAALRPGGHLLAVHWLPWAAEAPRDGMAAHRFLLAHPDLVPVVEHTDQAFVLHVLGRG